MSGGIFKPDLILWKLDIVIVDTQTYYINTEREIL